MIILRQSIYFLFKLQDIKMDIGVLIDKRQR